MSLDCLDALVTVERIRKLDAFGYHTAECKIGALSAIRLHDEVFSLLAKLFRHLRVDAIVIVEPLRLFADAGAQ